jgi:hypothetical protein
MPNAAVPTIPKSLGVVASIGGQCPLNLWSERVGHKRFLFLCATAWNSQCRGSELRLALLLRSSGERLVNPLRPGRSAG